MTFKLISFFIKINVKIDLKNSAGILNFGQMNSNGRADRVRHENLGLVQERLQVRF